MSNLVMPFGVRAAASATGGALSRDMEIQASETTELHFYDAMGCLLYRVPLNAGDVYHLKRTPAAVRWVVACVHSLPEAGNTLRSTTCRSHAIT